MAKFLTNLNLDKNELQNARIQNLSSHPSGGKVGQLYYNTSDKMLYTFDGSNWIASSGDGEANVITEIKRNGVALVPSNKSVDISVPTKTSDITNDSNYVTSGDLADVATSGSYGDLNGVPVAATDSTDGLMSASDKSRLDGMDTGAQVNVIETVKVNNTALTVTSKAVNISLGTAATLDTGTSSGNIPLLDASGKLPTTILPALAISDTFVVASENAMLALIAQTGDVAVRTDLSKSFILKGNDPTKLADWQELLTPTMPSEATVETAGLMSAGDKIKLNGISVGATKTESSQTNGNIKIDGSETTVYTHPTGDGNKHVPATGTTNNGNFLKSGATAGSEAWAKIGISDVDTLSTALSGKTNKYSADIGNGILTTFTVNHKLNTQDVVVTVRETVSPFEVVYADVQITDANNIKVLFATAPTSNQYRVVVIG